MKNKGLIFLGVLLIIGIFLMSPVSAAKTIGHGSCTQYYGYGAKDIYSWKAVKYNKNYIKVTITERSIYNTLPEEKRITVFHIKKKNKNSVKLIQRCFSNYGTNLKYTYTYYIKKGNVSKFYKSKIFKSWFRVYYT